MKKIFLLLFIQSLIVVSLNAQCSNLDGGIDATTGQDFNDDTQTTPLRKSFSAPIYSDAVDIRYATFDGTFVRVGDVVGGRTYEILTRSATQYTVTVRKQDGTLLVSGLTPLSFTPATSDSIQIHTNKTGAPCSATFSSLNLQMRCTSCGAAPNVANNLCSGAIVIAPSAITGYSISDPVSPSFLLETTHGTLNATTTFCGSAQGDDDDVWYSFTAPSSGMLVVRHGRLGIPKMYNTGTASSFIGASIHTGSSCTPSIAIVGGCKSTATVSNQLTFTGLSSGTTYYLRMWSNGLNGFASAPIYLFSSTVVPVELTDFKAKYTTINNQLMWTTASEKNVDRFAIQRSIDGATDWQSIGSVKAKGNSDAVSTYQFADETPFRTSYYRLETVDMDGTTSLSKIVSVNRQNNGKLTLTKAVSTLNTEGSNVSLDVNTTKASNLTLRLTDAVGRTILTKNYTATEGDNTLQCPMSALAKGVYMLSLTDGESRITTKIVKQ